MQTLHIERYSDYLDYLEVHPEEFIQLFNTILINVTGFSRYGCLGVPRSRSHPAAYRRQAAARAHSGLERWLRLGEEAYTLAIVLAEALGLEGFRQRVKIYATDVDEEALVQAGRPVTVRETCGVSPNCGQIL